MPQYSPHLGARPFCVRESGLGLQQGELCTVSIDGLARYEDKLLEELAPIDANHMERTLSDVAGRSVPLSSLASLHSNTRLGTSGSEYIMSRPQYSSPRVWYLRPLPAGVSGMDGGSEATLGNPSLIQEGKSHHHRVEGLHVSTCSPRIHPSPFAQLSRRLPRVPLPPRDALAPDQVFPKRPLRCVQVGSGRLDCYKVHSPFALHLFESTTSMHTATQRYGPTSSSRSFLTRSRWRPFTRSTCCFSHSSTVTRTGCGATSGGSIKSCGSFPSSVYPSILMSAPCVCFQILWLT